MDNEQKARDAAAALLPYVSPAMSEQDMEGYTSPLSAGEPELALMWLLGYAGLPQTHAPGTSSSTPSPRCPTTTRTTTHTCSTDRADKLFHNEGHRHARWPSSLSRLVTAAADRTRL